MVQIYPSQKISAIQFFLSAPQELIDKLTTRLDSYPFAGRMVFPGKVYSVNIFNRARPFLVRVIAHPGDDEVDPEHVVFLLRYKLFAARAEADLHSMDGGVSIFIQDHLRASSLFAPPLPVGVTFPSAARTDTYPPNLSRRPPLMHHLPLPGACRSAQRKVLGALLRRRSGPAILAR